MFNFCVLSGHVLEDPKISFVGWRRYPQIH